MDRRYSYVCLSVKLPRHSVWPILPGDRSFLNYMGGGRLQALALVLSFLLRGRVWVGMYLLRYVECPVWYVKVSDDEN